MLLAKLGHYGICGVSNDWGLYHIKSLQSIYIRRIATCQVLLVEKHAFYKVQKAKLQATTNQTFNNMNAKIPG